MPDSNDIFSRLKKTGDSPSGTSDIFKRLKKTGDSPVAAPATQTEAPEAAPKRSSFFRRSAEAVEEAIPYAIGGPAGKAVIAGAKGIASAIKGDSSATAGTIPSETPRTDVSGGSEASLRANRVPGPVHTIEDVLGGIVAPVVGAKVGGPLGAGVGAVLGDVAGAEVNKRFFGQTGIDDSAMNIAQNEAINFGVNAGLELIPRYFAGITGASGLVGGAEEAGTKVEAKGARTMEKARDTMQVAPKDVEAIKTEETAKLAPTARQQAIQKALGRTPEETAQALNLPTEKTSSGVSLLGQGTIQRKQDFYNAMYSPVTRMYDELGSKYEKFFAPYKNAPITNADSMGTALTDEVQYAMQNGVKYGRPVQQLIDQATDLSSKIAPKPGELPTAVEDMNGKIIKRGEVPDNLFEAYAKLQGDRPVIPPATVGQWLGLRSQASKVLKTAEGPDRAAAKALLDGIDDTLGESGIPKARDLNTQYRATKDLFDQTFFRTLGKTHEPTDVLNKVFAQPDRAKLIIENATPAQQATLRTMYADAVNRYGVKYMTPEQRPMIKKLFAGTPLADDKNWINLDAGMTRYEDVLKSSPEMAQQLTNNINKRLFELRDEQAAKAVKLIHKDAEKMGPLGKSLIKLLNDNAKNPVQAVEAAEKWYESAPEAASIHALQTGKLSKGAGGFVATAVHRLQWYIPMMAATTLAGHPSTWGGAGIALGAGAGVHLAIQKALVHAMQNPELATKFYQMMTKPTVQQASTMQLSRLIGDALAADTAGKIEDQFGTRLANQPQQP